MKHLKLAVACGLAAVLCVAGIALGQGAGNQNPPRYGCHQRFQALDANHDGKLTLKEFMAAHHWRSNPEQRFKAMDVKGQGYLTVDEFCAGKPPGWGRGRGVGPGPNR